ncbi:MAG: hypothetical protein KAS29_17425, partial [Bacteroidales bacterium]|nr:hypothetical protein [Bacteroidales bacterium]
MKKLILSLLALLLFSIGIYAQQPPQVDNPIDDVTENEGFGSTTVDLTDVFSDPDGDAITLTATSDNEDVVTVAISLNTLTITEVGNGICNVTVNAASVGPLDVDDVFVVTVNNLPDPPQVDNPIDD